MPRLNYYIILFSLLFYFLCSGVTIRDRILVDTFHCIERHSLVPPASRQLFEGAMGGMFRTLDKYSYYTPASGKKDYNDHLDNHYEGIGLLSYPARDKKSVEVLYPLVDSPAFRAGLRSGDRILAVNGIDLTASQVTNFSALIKKFKGAEVVLTVLQFGKTESIKVAIRTAPLNMDSVEGDGIDSDGGRNFLLESDKTIGYIRVTSFSRRTVDEFSHALRQLYQKQAQGLILDLRGNPGGYVEASVEMARMLLKATEDSTVIVTTKFRDGTIKKNYYGNKNSQICSLPIVVLIDGNTASASEILAAALQDYQRAVIVGTRSFGKGVVQGIYDLPANSGTYQLTGVNYWRPSNKNIHRNENAKDSDEWGVIPDVECKLDLEKWRSRAIDSIRNRRANAISENREMYLNSYIETIEQEIEEYRNELKNSDKKNKRNNTKTEPEIEIETDGVIETSNDAEVETGNDNVESGDREDDEDIDIPFKLQGDPPYYDPQLDKAIEILKTKITEQVDEL
jgi:carboxyl-terminal processing protease